MATTSALVDFPETGPFVTDFEKSILGIMTLPAVGAGNETAKVCTSTIVIIRDSESRPTTTRHQEHAETGRFVCLLAL